MTPKSCPGSFPKEQMLVQASSNPALRAVLSVLLFWLLVMYALNVAAVCGDTALSVLRFCTLRQEPDPHSQDIKIMTTAVSKMH